MKAISWKHGISETGERQTLPLESEKSPVIHARQKMTFGRPRGVCQRLPRRESRLLTQSPFFNGMVFTDDSVDLQPGTGLWERQLGPTMGASGRAGGIPGRTRETRDLGSRIAKPGQRGTVMALKAQA